MSLTSHLDDKASPIGQFLRTRFAQTVTITKVTNPRLRLLSTLRPQPQLNEAYPYGGIGHAIDYRIRYSFAVTPWERLVAAQGALYLRAWADNLEYTTSLIAGFANHLATMLADIQPAGRALSRDEEELLARYCYILGLFEAVFRTGQAEDVLLQAVCSHPDTAARGLSRGRPDARTASEAEVEACIAQLLASVAGHWLDDLVSLGTLASEQLSHLLTEPSTLNPTFAGSGDVGGADADLIVSGCLIDIKASVNSSIQPAWLRQLVGYVLLDYEDTCHIDSVGIYMARQGALLQWPLTEFLGVLTGNPSISVADLRSEFRTVCQGSRLH